MPYTKDDLLKFQNQLQEEITISPPITTHLGATFGKPYQYEHLIAKTYLLGLFKRFPLYNDENLAKIESRINHFQWVRYGAFNAGTSSVNTALNSLPQVREVSANLNRATRYQTEHSLMRGLLLKIFSEKSALETEDATALLDLKNNEHNFYEMTESPETSVIRLSGHVSSYLHLFEDEGYGSPAVFRACKEGDALLVKQLIALGADVNAILEDNIITGQVPIFKLFPSFTKDVSLEGKFSLLQLATALNKLAVVRVLLDIPAINANYIDPYNYDVRSLAIDKSALSLAIDSKFKEIALLLLADPKVSCHETDVKKMIDVCKWLEAKEIYDAKMQPTPLFKAVLGSRYNRIATLVNSGSPEYDHNMRRPVDNKTALELALEGSVDQVATMVLSNRDFDYDPMKLLLNYMSYYENSNSNRLHVDVVDRIFDSGKIKDVNAFVTNWNGTYNDRLLNMAARSASAYFIEFLVEKQSADVNVRGYEGYSPLHCALASGKVFHTKLLLKNGADINAVSDKGLTPLRCAVDYVETSSAEWKLESLHVLIADANIDLTQKIHGKTIDQIAQERKWTSVTAALEQRGKTLTSVGPLVRLSINTGNEGSSSKLILANK